MFLLLQQTHVPHSLYTQNLKYSVRLPNNSLWLILAMDLIVICTASSATSRSNHCTRLGAFMAVQLPHLSIHALRYIHVIEVGAFFCCDQWLLQLHRLCLLPMRCATQKDCPRLLRPTSLHYCHSRPITDMPYSCLINRRITLIASPCGQRSFLMSD